jgi:hypothetical protein
MNMAAKSAKAPEEEGVEEPVSRTAFTVDPADFTYGAVPESPEEAARIPEILKAYEMSLASNPLPLEWLVASLQAGIHLDHPVG